MTGSPSSSTSVPILAGFVSISPTGAPVGAFPVVTEVQTSKLQHLSLPLVIDSKNMVQPSHEAKSPVQNYASLLKSSAQMQELGNPTEHVSGVPFVLIPDENIESAKLEFKDFIYARFHGDIPQMGRIIGVINVVWAKSGPKIYVHRIGHGYFLLRVTNPKILSRTCWNIAGAPMFVAPWSPDFSPKEAPLTYAVVPVEMHNVPYLLFNKESLNRLATAIGKPDSLAPETERKLNFEVAEMYVKVDLIVKLPQSIVSGFSNGMEKYGHKTDKCRVNVPHGSPERTSAKKSNPEAPRDPSKSRHGRCQDPKIRRGSAGHGGTSRVEELSDQGVGVPSPVGISGVEELSKQGVGVTFPVGISGVYESSKQGVGVTPSPGNSEAVIVSKEVTEPDMEEGEFRPSDGVEAVSQRGNGSAPAGSANMDLTVGIPTEELSGTEVTKTYGLSVDVRSSSVVIDESLDAGPKLRLDKAKIVEEPFFLVNNRKCGRKCLWEGLVELHDSTPVSRFPWADLGDFNQMLRTSHHSNHFSSQVDEAGIEDANLCLQDAQLFEAQFKGPPFTWRNSQDENPISTRIDHALINQHWTTKFPDSFADFLDPSQSEHAPCLFRLPSATRRVCKTFKFYHHVVDHPQYNDIVSGSWQCDQITGTNQFKLVRSMKLLKGGLKRLNKQHFSGISQRVKDQSVVVVDLQRSLLTSPDIVTAREEHVQRQKLNVLLTAEEKFYKQRSRVRWADVGDRNTVFYHRVVSQHQTRNHIHYLKDESDHLYLTTDDIKSHSAAYFQSILGNTDLPISSATIPDL
ncbi:PREDICTED: uncharacterized protein LOC106338171 [Brassica oleracea var. oleracea]|uniref:uncharacterized protein LOC106338171 n=1 Tax=Brassica oleracea var. oleracea TaxID=109376 RepID=UPI0006A6D92B|nr:PREDICTED: uncharacterized protein LOC106338171 [Brassica oleracea var. oleracea]